MDFASIIETIKGLIETVMGMVGGEGFDPSAIIEKITGLLG
jgi:hypothetical protein